ncbi:MAG: Hsp70 family protein [Methanospirillum sp.]
MMGIDFGTWNSSGVVQEGSDEGIPLYTPIGKRRSRDEKQYPSFVQYDDHGRITATGISAKLAANHYKDSTVYDVKRFLGRSVNDPLVQEYKAMLEKLGHYQLTGDENGQVMIQIGDSKLRPEEVAGDLLETIIKDALTDKRLAMMMIERLVLSVPAFYDPNQREKTKIAAIRAIQKLQQNNDFAKRITIPDLSGKNPDAIEEIQLIEEPTAALLTFLARTESHGLTIPLDKYVLCFDLGAGTLDITIGKIKKVPNVFTGKPESILDVRTKRGNTQLGGRDMDQILTTWARSQIDSSQHELTEELLHDLNHEVELAKIRLSKPETISTDINIMDRGIVIPFTRAELEHQLDAPIISPGSRFPKGLFIQIREEIRCALSKAGIQRSDLGTVILVGGPTKMPSVRRIVEEETIPILDIPEWDPMLCVAEGAARYGASGTDTMQGGAEIVGSVPVGYDFYAAVKMFDDVEVFVSTQLVSHSDFFPITLTRELLVPKGNKDVRNASIQIVRANAGDVKSINDIHVAFTKTGNIETKKLRYSWNCFQAIAEARNQEVDLTYGRIRMTFSITQDGLIKKPVFEDPSSPGRIEFPDPPIMDLGRISFTTEQDFERNWTDYAKRDCDIENDRHERRIQELMARGMSRRDAEISIIKAPSNSWNNIRILAGEAIRYCKEKRISIVIELERVYNNSNQVETAGNKQALLNVINRAQIASGLPKGEFHDLLVKRVTSR